MRARWNGLTAALLLTACGNGGSDNAMVGGNAAAALPATAPAAATAVAAAAPAAGRVSRFSKLIEANCPIKETIEETGDWVRTCPGVAGFTLEWSTSDLRDDLDVIAGGKSHSLNFPSLVGNGAFNSLGETVEWRGPDGRAPDVLVARVYVSGPDGKADSGRLAIARLGPAPCVVAIVPPGAGQSDRARVIADGKLPACLKD